MENYWTRLTTNRLSRRRALAATGASAAAAAILAACGGGSSGGSKAESDKNSLVTKPVDTSKQAARGGVLKFYATGDAPSLDPYTSNINLNQFEQPVYSRLTGLKPGYLAPRAFEVVPDLAQSWEWAADGLTLTIKLRQDVKWHNKPPVNGRPMDATDVVFSWE